MFIEPLQYDAFYITCEKCFLATVKMLAVIWWRETCSEMTSAPVMNALAVGKLLQQHERHKWRPEQASGRKGHLNVGIDIFPKQTDSLSKGICLSDIFWYLGKEINLVFWSVLWERMTKNECKAVLSRRPWRFSTCLPRNLDFTFELEGGGDSQG